jgi:hypothetical protein
MDDWFYRGSAHVSSRRTVGIAGPRVQAATISKLGFPMMFSGGYDLDRSASDAGRTEADIRKVVNGDIGKESCSDEPSGSSPMTSREPPVCHSERRLSRGGKGAAAQASNKAPAKNTTGGRGGHQEHPHLNVSVGSVIVV